MGITKQYLRFIPSAVFGIIGSTRGGVTSIPNRKHLIATAAAEHVVIWNTKTGEKVATLVGDKHQATALCSLPQHRWPWGAICAVQGSGRHLGHRRHHQRCSCQCHRGQACYISLWGLACAVELVCHCPSCLHWFVRWWKVLSSETGLASCKKTCQACLELFSLSSKLLSRPGASAWGRVKHNLTFSSGGRMVWK